MAKVILHIGYPKTATKWFLGNFYPNVKNAGIIYNENLYYDTTPGKEFFEVKPDEHYIEKELKIIATHALSGFVNGKWEHGIYRQFFLKQLKEKYPDASVIIFIRNQLEFIPSMYSSYLKRGGTASIAEVFSISSENTGEFFSYEFLDYHKTISQFQNVFGKQNVYIFIYEDFLENNTEFMKNFTSIFGMSIDLKCLSNRKKNIKLRRGLISLLRKTNLLFQKGLSPKKNIVNWPWVYTLFNKNIDIINEWRIWGQKPKSSEMLGNEMSDFIIDYYRESNRKLIEDFNLKSIEKYKYTL
jgi:hypothetical protein